MMTHHHIIRKVIHMIRMRNRKKLRNRWKQQINSSKFITKMTNNIVTSKIPKQNLSIVITHNKIKIIICNPIMMNKTSMSHRTHKMRRRIKINPPKLMTPSKIIRRVSILMVVRREDRLMINPPTS